MFLLFSLLISLVLIFPQFSFANTSIKVSTTGDSEASVKVESEDSSSNHYESSTNNQVKVESSSSDQNNNIVIQNSTGNSSISVKNNQFEIKGKITSVSENNFVVASQTIFLDSETKSKYKNLIVVGETIQVEGTIKNGNKYASEINTENNKTSEDEGSEDSSIEASSSANIDSESNIVVVATGPIEQVKMFLEKLLLKLSEMF